MTTYYWKERVSMKRFIPRGSRILGLVTVLLFFCAAFMVPSSAAAGDIRSIHIDAAIQHGGTIQVKETWSVDVPDNWTEMYLVKDNMEDMEVLDFSVKDLTTGTEYTNIGEWDINRSRSEKAGKCGSFVDSDGALELCYGVGSSGEHTYEVSYALTNAVNRYSDGYEGFNIRFVNDELSSVPQDITMTISAFDEEGNPLPFTEENTRFWAFGIEGGETELKDGQVLVRSMEGSRNYYCNVLMRFDEGMFAPDSAADSSFEALREEAFEDSEFYENEYQNWNNGNYESYTEDYSTEEAALGIFSLFFPLLLIGGMFRGVNKGAARAAARGTGFTIDPSLKKTEDYWRDIPFGGDLNESFLMLERLDKKETDSRIISAYILRWLQNGHVTVDKMPAKKFLGLVEGSEEVSIHMNSEPDFQTEEERSLWKLLRAAAGGDQILQESELLKWSTRHYNEVGAWYQDLNKAGIAAAVANGDIERTESRIFLTKHYKQELSKQGETNVRNLFGFKNYLKDFTLVNEREPKDVGLWKDYLVFAALFGIADEVAKQFKELLPDYFLVPQNYGVAGDLASYDMLRTINMINAMSNSTNSGYNAGLKAAQERAEARSSSGGSWSSSSGGGGGFSSGGGGGGFSGGGSGGGGR